MVLGTRERIINAYFSLAIKYPEKYRFTVAEIAEEAGISRQAIYKNHFNTPEEIMAAVHQEIDHDIEEELNCNVECFSNINPVEFFADRLVPVLYRNRDLLRYLYTTNIDPGWRLFLKSRYTKWVENYVVIHNNNLGLLKDMSVELFINLFLAIIESWIVQPIPITPDLFADELKKICDCSILSFIS